MSTSSPFSDVMLRGLMFVDIQSKNIMMNVYERQPFPQSPTPMPIPNPNPNPNPISPLVHPDFKK